MSEKTKLFLTILFRYVVVALLGRLVDIGVFTKSEAESFTPWLVEVAVTLGVPTFIAFLAHYASKSRLRQVEAAASLQPEDASMKNINEVANQMKKEGL